MTPEFLAYYAMPYVPEIAKHPSFKDLFTTEWATALKVRVRVRVRVTTEWATALKVRVRVRVRAQG